jgi:hypothetical protein
MFQLHVEAVLLIINSILCLGIKIQKNFTLHQRHLSIILSLTNSTFLTVDRVISDTEKCVPNSCFSFSFPQETVYSSAGLVPPLSHLTPCTPTKSNLYFDSSFATVIMKPTLYRLFMYRIPNFISNFVRNGRLGWILERWDGVMWTGLVWLRIRTGGELHKMLGNYRVAKELVASRVVLSSM